MSFTTSKHSLAGCACSTLAILDKPPTNREATPVLSALKVVVKYCAHLPICIVGARSRRMVGFRRACLVVSCTVNSALAGTLTSERGCSQVLLQTRMIGLSVGALKAPRWTGTRYTSIRRVFSKWFQRVWQALRSQALHFWGSFLSETAHVIGLMATFALDCLTCSKCATRGPRSQH